MRTEIDLVLMITSMVLFGIVAGTYAAMQILAYTRAERNGTAEEGGPRYVARLLENPVPNYLALGAARILLFIAVAFSAYRVCTAHLFTDGPSLRRIIFVAAALLVPLMSANLAALRAPDKFVANFRWVSQTVVYLVSPVVYPIVALLRRVSPDLLGAVAFHVLPFKRHIELSGYGNVSDESQEQSLVSSVFEFGDTKVREVMVPRIDMVAVNIHDDPAEALDVIVEAGHSRVPVYEETIDRIVGVVHTKDLLRKTIEGGNISFEEIMRDVYFVPESKKIDELLGEFKTRRIHIAIVVDEYGGTAGLITLEDVLEELVGDIQDEFDTEEELIRVIDADSALCNSRVNLDDLNEALNIELPAGDADTLGGFLYEVVGRVPRVGEVFEHDSLSFRIESVVRQRIDKVLIKGLSKPRGGVGDNLG